MEDDDEFGDLYSDVLLPFASSSSAAPHPSSPRPSIDLNLNLQTDRKEELVCMAPYPNSDVPCQSFGQTTSPNHGESVIDDAIKSKQEQSSGEAMVLERAEEELAGNVLSDMNHGKLSSVNDVHSEAAVKEKDSMDMDVKFDIEENGDGVEVVGSEPIIPGLSSDAGVLAPSPGRIDENGDRGQGDEWDSDSDSEDDLQIVLNDNNHTNMERAGMVADGDDDNVDDDPNQAVEKQEWGENATQPTDGERKDMGDSAKASGGVMVAPKIGYNNHAYHPFHSQFKYVRPGAAPIPGATNSTPGVSTGQIRPFNMVPVAGRGRGDWRPVTASLQKGFHAGLGLPMWGNTAAGRGFGGGLEFTLPSHKTIFDVDIESFEEKPWKYPGVDASDFFNFDLNGETWKDYCRKLEQLRLESTMQSKIRVYECGRTELEYDPDLPPELAAATGLQDARVENANSMKSDIGQSDPVKGSGRVRPPLPTGRAIQVESGNGDRLPTIDTRPPRIRDSDAIIEIVLQDSADDDSYAEVGVQDQSEGGEPQREDFQGGILGDNNPRAEHEFLNGFPQYYNGRKRDLAGKKLQFMNAPASIPGGTETLPFPREKPQLSRPFGGKFGSSYGERKMQGRAKSLITTPRQETEINDNKREDSFESMEGRDSTLLSSPIIRDARESRMEMEEKDSDHVEFGTANESSKMGKVEMDPNTVDKSDTLTDREEKREKSTSRVEEPLLDEVGDVENSKPASSDSSLASSVRSMDYKKQLDEKEGVQDAQSAGLGGHRKHPDGYEDDFHRRGHDGRKEPERNCLIPKSREESHPYKDQHPNSLHQLHMKTGGFDRHKDRENPEIVQAGRDDPFGVGVRNDEPRKRDKGKARENKRSDRDDSLHSRKQLDNGGYWAPHDQEIGLRDVGHRDRDDSIKSRYDEAMEDYHSKKRKEKEYHRREHIDKDNISHGYRESSSRRRRERDVVLDPQTRNDQQRSRREREGKISIRSGRGTEEKARPGHSRAQDEHKAIDKAYQSRDTMQHSEQLKRRDGVRNVSPHIEGREDSYTRGTQNFSEEKLSRQDRSGSHGDRVFNASDSQRVNERKHREGTKRIKKSDVIGLSKRNREDHSGETNKKGLKDLSDEGHAEQEISGHGLSRKHQDDISSDDEQQDSRRGRTKLERWTSHKERDFDVNGKPDKDSNDGSSEAGKPVVASAKRSDTIDNQRVSLAEGKGFVDMEGKDADTNGFGEQHLDTVEKLKKRSERFKLPMPSEKEALTIKKLENEPLPSAKSENHVDSEVKQERPARKRRWISN